MPHPPGLALASLLAALALAPLSSLHAQQAASSRARLGASIDSIVQAELIAKGAVGVSLVIARGGETLLERSWGLADVDAKRPADASTSYRIGSMSKQFTAALVLKQVDRGRASLRDTIGRYLTGLKPEWTGRTIEQLLNHTAGMPREYRDPRRMAESFVADSLIAMAARSTAPTPPAGASWGYSNTGYMLLGALVEQLYGTSYGAAIRDEIARPLGLATLGFCGDTEAAGGAKGYVARPGAAVAPAPYLHPSYMLGGSVCSSAGDVVKWNLALHGGKVLSAASYAAMTTPRDAAARAQVPYGFGLYVRPMPGGGTVIVHDGSTPGYAAENLWYPAESLSVTVLTNTSGPLNANTNLSDAIAGIVLGRAPAPKAAPAGRTPRETR
jgi:D-alanyl-D-alanine carboxypeptidase